MKSTSLLTGLRGIAACWVAAFHSYNYFFVFTLFMPLYPHIPFLIGINPHAPALISHGYLGVDLFFMLSGFVLTLNYIDTFGQQGLGAYKKYIIARFARIYPAYILVVLLGAVIIALNLAFIPKAMGTWANFLQSLPLMFFLLHDVFFNSIETAIKPFWWYNAPLWSASIEWVSYCFAPFLLMFLYRFKLITVSIFGLLGLCFLQYIVLYHSPTFQGNPVKIIAFFFYGWPGFLRYGIEFLAGSVACLVATQVKFISSKWGDILGFICLLGLFVCASYYQYVGLFCCLLALFFIFAVQSNGLITKTLGGKLMTFLGKISYCLYLTHYIVLHIFVQYFLKTKTYQHLMHSETSRILWYMGFWVSALFVAWLLHQFVEAPCRKVIRQKYMH